jgi:transposase
MALRDYTAEQVATALREADGIITDAAEALGCSRSTIYRAMDEYVTVKEAREEAQADLVGEAESQLAQKMREGDMKAIRMILRTQRPEKWEPKRQQKVEHEGGFAVQINPPADD